jgi:hypothetical protein
MSTLGDHSGEEKASRLRLGQPSFDVIAVEQVFDFADGFSFDEGHEFRLERSKK